MSERYDLAIVGGGLVGLAAAYQILRRRPALRLAILEKEPEVARHQSSRNTGVLHAGIYYRPGSMKARLCREGKRELEAFAEEHRVPFVRNGKLIVALDEDECGRLALLRERALANGVEGIEEIGPERIREIEPHLLGVRALYSPATGSIDFGRVARALAGEIMARGGSVLTGHAVTGMRERGGAWMLSVDAAEAARAPREDADAAPEMGNRRPGTVLEARRIITAGGLYSDRLAAMTGPAGDLKIVPFRGDYYSLVPTARHLVRAHINPVPDPRLPFLGVHFSRRIDGEVWAGPNAVLAFAREGYRFRTVSARDLAETLAFPGFHRLARRYLSTGIRELWRDLSKRTFLASLRRYLPGLEARDLAPGRSGVRAQCLDRAGTLVDDFVITQARGALHVRNAPSPAATSCLAIGRHLADLAEPLIAS